MLRTVFSESAGWYRSRRRSSCRSLSTYGDRSAGSRSVRNRPGRTVSSAFRVSESGRKAGEREHVPVATGPHQLGENRIETTVSGRPTMSQSTYGVFRGIQHSHEAQPAVDAGCPSSA